MFLLSYISVFNCERAVIFNFSLTQFRMEDDQKGPLPSSSFSPVSSTNGGLASKTSWLLVLTVLSHWRKISRPYLVPVPNYWTPTNSTPQKHGFFWSNSYKINVMITSLIEMLELPNFDHKTTPTIWFDSRDNIVLVTSQIEVMTS